MLEICGEPFSIFLYDKLLSYGSFVQKEIYQFQIQFCYIEPQILTIFPVFTIHCVENRWVIIGHSCTYS